MNYLVFGVSYYTMQQFKSHKSLESYEAFYSGWVQDLAIFKPPSGENSVVLAKVSFFTCVLVCVSHAAKGEGHGHR